MADPWQSTQFRLPPRLDAGPGLDETEIPFASEEPSEQQGSARFHRVPEEFEDKRAERQKYGFIKYNLEKGVPDVGGLGWRSKQGHTLKNQSYYSAFPNTNLWNNPAHAGPRTWKGYHGPRLRNDAQLMENLDLLDSQQAEWDTKKMFVNTVRVQTLDRFYNQKIHNEQKEVHNTWAPNRRAKREYHDDHDHFDAEIDSMPMKELRKVLTPAVLHGDREAIRNISTRIQREETWKETWKGMEEHRRKDALADMEERMTYNQMLCDLAGQPVRRRDPDRKLPNNCSERVEQLAMPRPEPHIEDVTQLTDFRGLIHVDHQTALEARFPGKGQQLAAVFREKVTDSTKPGWPGPARPETPQGLRKHEVKVKDPSRVNLKRASVPCSKLTLDKALDRSGEDAMMRHAIPQHLSNEAPPPPEQRKTVLLDKALNDAEFMMEKLASTSSPASGSSQMPVGARSREDRPPAFRSMVYPVLVSVAPKLAAKRAQKEGVRLGGNIESPTATGDSSPVSARSPRKWKRLAKDVRIARLGISIHSAHNIRAADRGGNSDPYVVVKIPGRAKQKYTTKVKQGTLKPVWQESFEFEDYNAGDELEFCIYDKDVWATELLGKATLTQAQIMPDGIGGELELFDEKQPDSNPVLRMKVQVLENFDPDGRLEAKAQRGAQDSDEDEEAPPVHDTCKELDAFDSNLRPVPRLGNFWMTPRGDMKRSRHDGSAPRRTPRQAAAAAELGTPQS